MPPGEPAGGAPTPLRRLARARDDGRLDPQAYRRHRGRLLEALESGALRPPFREWDDPAAPPPPEDAGEHPPAEPDAGEPTMRLEVGPEHPHRRRRAMLILALVGLAVIAAWVLSGDGGGAPVAPHPAGTLPQPASAGS